jgi:hypothetical protein
VLGGLTFRCRPIEQHFDPILHAVVRHLETSVGARGAGVIGGDSTKLNWYFARASAT